MVLDRRRMLGVSAGALGGVALGCTGRSPGEESGIAVDAGDSPFLPVPESIRALNPMTDGIAPITDEERLARMEKARRLMVENGMDARLAHRPYRRGPGRRIVPGPIRVGRCDRNPPQQPAASWTPLSNPRPAGRWRRP